MIRVSRSSNNVASIKVHFVLFKNSICGILLRVLQMLTHRPLEFSARQIIRNIDTRCFFYHGDYLPTGNRRVQSGRRYGIKRLLKGKEHVCVRYAHRLSLLHARNGFQTPWEEHMGRERTPRDI